MQTKTDPWKLTLQLIKRSVCRVQMGAVVTDRRGRIVSWGWNHPGADGMGMCAERHALGRANPKRLRGAEIHVRGFNRVNESGSKPCPRCREALARVGIDVIHYRDDRKQRRRATLSALLTAA